LAESKKAREWSGLPPNAIAIGANGGGDQLVLLSRPDASDILGPIDWWDHETGESVKVADDFEELE
jgi:hypothetical protein